MYKVTVVMPTYNGSAFVEDALSSVFGQTLTPEEIIVVDDCSADDTVAIVETSRGKSPIPLRLIRLSRNSGGPARPINDGVAAAKSEFIAVLDQDDLLLPRKLELETKQLAENEEVSIAAGMVGRSSFRDEVWPWQRERFRSLGSADPDAFTMVNGKDMLRALVLYGNFLMGYPGFTFRKSDWLAKGGVAERLRVASDLDFLCWLCTRGNVALHPSMHYVRREHASNVCNDQERMNLEVARVQSAQLIANPWLLQDDSVCQSLRESFDGHAYWARQSGDYRRALELYSLTAKVWGWDVPLVKSLCKCFLHGFLSLGSLRGRVTHS